MIAWLPEITLQLARAIREQSRLRAVLSPQATFLLAGWTKEEPRTHVVKLVDASKVLAVRDTLQPLTSYHAYSVQPSVPQVTDLISAQCPSALKDKLSTLVLPGIDICSVLLRVTV